MEGGSIISAEISFECMQMMLINFCVRGMKYFRGVQNNDDDETIINNNENTSTVNLGHMR